MEVGGSWGLHTSQVRSGVSPRGRGSAERSRGSHLTSLLAATHATDKRIKKVFFPSQYWMFSVTASRFMWSDMSIQRDKVTFLRWQSQG